MASSLNRRERAHWGVQDERVLLELFLEARSDPELRSERGVRAPGWQQMVTELNKRCHRNFDKDQLKSKYARIIQEYEMYKSVHKLLVAGSGADDAAWDKLLAERPRTAPQLRQLKENGFAHVDICQRILGDANESSDSTNASGKRARAEDESGNAVSGKKPRLSTEGRRERAVWGLAEEKLLLFLYQRAKSNPEMRSDKGIRSKGWLSVVGDLNKYSGKYFDKDQCKSKYQRIMLEYDVFKSSTNYPSKSTLDNSEWDRLIEERPRYAPQLRQLKERGFQHAEACAIITGDVQGNMSETSVSEFMASQARSTDSAGTAASQSVEQAPGVPLPAPLAMANNVLPFLLPTAGSAAASQPQAPRRAAEAADSIAPQVDSTFFTPELRDNLNQFLKTATAYMLMQMNKQN